MPSITSLPDSEADVRKVLDLWSSRPIIDWLLVGLITGAYEIFSRIADTQGPIADLSSAGRTVFYETLAGISGALLGFAIAAVAILLGLGSGPRVEFVRKSRWAPQIAKTFTGTIRALALTTLVMVLALLLDAGDIPSSAWELLVVGAVALGTIRTVRATWLLNNLVDLAYQDSTPATTG